MLCTPVYVKKQQQQQQQPVGQQQAQKGGDREEDREVRFVLRSIVGKKDGLGVENLRGSGLIAGETSRAYEEIFTLTYVTGRSGPGEAEGNKFIALDAVLFRFCTAGIFRDPVSTPPFCFIHTSKTTLSPPCRSVGIGAYLARLGQRVIQKASPAQPIILTGFNALNKLLGKQVYSSNVQLGA